MTDTSPVATEITRLTAAGKTERELVAAVAWTFPDLTISELSAALQDATAAAERQIISKRFPAPTFRVSSREVMMRAYEQASARPYGQPYARKQLTLEGQSWLSNIFPAVGLT
jgi:hypothetical protein